MELKKRSPEAQRAYWEGYVAGLATAGRDIERERSVAYNVWLTLGEPQPAPTAAPRKKGECVCGHPVTQHSEGKDATNMETGEGFVYEGCQAEDCDCPFVPAPDPPQPADTQGADSCNCTGQPHAVHSPRGLV